MRSHVYKAINIIEYIKQGSECYNSKLCMQPIDQHGSTLNPMNLIKRISKIVRARTCHVYDSQSHGPPLLFDT